MVAADDAERPPTERWSALGGVLLSALYLWVLLWLLLAVVLPSVSLGWKPVVITSGSMEPLIRPGDIVLSGGAQDVEPGQVVTYEDPARDGSLTTHRIVSVDEDGALRTQGDANATPDSTLVPSENVVGRGRLLVPMIGLPLLWLSGGAVLFGLWLLVTAVSVGVVAGGGGSGGPPGPSGGIGSPTVWRVLGRFQTVRPRVVQTTIVGWLVRVVRRVHDRVYTGYRPEPSRLRRGAPSTAILLLLLGLARTPSAVLIGVVGLALVLAFDVDGPQLRIGRWERLAIRAGRLVTSSVSGPGSGRGLLVVAMVVAMGTSTVGRSVAAFSAAADNSGSTFTAASAFPTDDLVLYLQNDPEGADTVGETDQPMSTTVPTQTTLPNYDTGTDLAPGLLLKNAGADQHEPDNAKVQRWLYTPSTDLTIASAQVVFHSANKDFALNKDATVTWYLRHCDVSGGDCVELAESTIVEADWSAGQAAFVERTTGLGTVNHAVPAGRQLQLAVIVPTSGSDLWFAYDTADQQSRLELVTATPGVCPGSGSSVQHVQGDTFVEEDKPLDNLSTNNVLTVASELGKNRRSLLTVALPTVPDGCTMTSATLRLTTTSSDIGRTFHAQRTDTAFDPSTVTWATQPTASGAIGSGPSTVNGPTTIDVLGPIQDLYASGNTGLVLRDSVESEATGTSNSFRSLDARPYPEPEGPRLEVTWGP